MSFTKPMLACDADLSLIRYPAIVMPKYDGVRMLNVDGKCVGRSLKPFPNPEIQRLFGGPTLAGLDGELLCSDMCAMAPEQCRTTASRTASRTGGDKLIWVLFDDFSNPEKGFIERLASADARTRSGALPFQVAVVARLLVSNETELLAFERDWLDLGAEGVIIRSAEGSLKSGRATAREATYLRIKRFTDAEAVVVDLIEAQHNGNEARTNELGHTERSSHKASLTGKGMVGALKCLLPNGDYVFVGPGTLTHDERTRYWQRPETLVGKTITFKHFSHGAKDGLRFPVFVRVRHESDISS